MFAGFAQVTTGAARVTLMDVLAAEVVKVAVSVGVKVTDNGWLSPTGRMVPAAGE